MSRPLIGLCAAIERAHFGPWTDEPTVLMPHSYVRAIQACGALVAMLPPDEPANATLDALLEHLDGLVLGGGSDVDPSTHDSDPHPETVGTNLDRDNFELALARRAMERQLPLLGVCRGMQVMNVAAGGTLEQHLPDRLGHEAHRTEPGSWSEHPIRLRQDSLASRATGAETLTVKSHHHQGVAEVGEGLEISGWAEDDTVEAIEDPRRPFTLGVLWHPEEDPADRLIPFFVTAASEGAGVT